jgi:AcrR family transcriptional regulator
MDPLYRKRRPQQKRSHALVGSVVTALEQLIERTQDLSELSMRAIAHRAGVGVGSIYEYFHGQDALFDEFLAELTERNFRHFLGFMETTPALPLPELVTQLLDKVMDLYLSAPGRTKVAIAIIFRLGRADLVMRMRDRFAALCAERVLKDHPQLDRAQVEQVMRTTMDAVMGVVMAELWRQTPDVRQTLRQLTDALFTELLGISLWGRAGEPPHRPML